LVKEADLEHWDFLITGTIFYLMAPLGGAMSNAYAGTLAPNKVINEVENSAMLFGGNKANLVFADRLSSRAILQVAMHYQESVLYLVTKNNLVFYIWNDRLLSNLVKLDNELNFYIMRLNALYSNENNGNYSTDKLSKQSLIFLLNPFQTYSVVSLAKDYLIDGNARGKKIASIHFSKFN
jgi:hypothetical protein